MVEFESCPVCHGELEDGYLSTNAGIWWNSDKPRFWAGGGEFLGFSFFKIASLPGQRCTACRRIMVEYEDHTFKKGKLRGTMCPHCRAIYNYRSTMIIDNQVKCQNCAKPFSFDEQALV